MMTVLLFLVGVTTLALLVRALSSRDPRWMRGLAFAVAGTTLAVLPANLLLDWRLSSRSGLALLALAPAWLVGWAMLSRDPFAERLVSLVAALPAAFALFLLYISTEYYTE